MFNNDGGFTMPVVPAYGGVGSSGSGFLGGDGIWAILLFALIFGFGGFGGFGGGFGGNAAMSYDFPWLLNGQNGINNNVSGGFRDAMLNDGITSIRDGVSGLSTQICGLGGDIQLAMANAETAANARQMANMQTAFASQTAMSQGFNGLQSQLAQCCCDQRLATCQTQNIVQNEGAATRLAIQNQTQQILDKMCQQEIDALKAQNLELQNRVNMQALVASQTAQTAALVADNTAQTQYIVNRVAPYPIPAYTVANPVTPAAA